MIILGKKILFQTKLLSHELYLCFINKLDLLDNYMNIWGYCEPECPSENQGYSYTFFNHNFCR